MTLIDARIPAGLNDDGQTPDEQRQFSALQAYRALGILMQMTPPDVQIASWTIDTNAIYGMHASYGYNDDDLRASMRQMASALGKGFERTEKPHADGRNKMSINGSVNGVHVEVWVLLDPCECSCHSEVSS